MLYSAAFGDPATNGDKNDRVEPDELGTRIAEHGERVSIVGFPQFSATSILEAILHCR